MYSSKAHRRTGAIAILTVILMVLLLSLVAMAIDVGVMCVANAELRATADAAALAAAGSLYDLPDDLVTDVYYHPPAVNDVRETAREYVARNGTADHRLAVQGDTPLQVDWNYANRMSGDIVIGRLNVPSDLTEPFTPTTTTPNSVMVRVPMNPGHPNGPLKLFLTPLMGYFDFHTGGKGVATVDYPYLLPFTVYTGKWDSLASGGDGDSYAYSPGSVTAGSDNIPEIKVVFDSNWDGTGLPPGNFGSLDIGGVSGVDVLRAQIDKGPSKAEFDYHGGSFAAEQHVPGKTGVNGDIKSAIEGGHADDRVYAGMLGKTRYLPLYTSVTGNGSNSEFTLHCFVAVRIVAVKMPKYIVFQPVTKMNDLVHVRLTR